MYYVTERKECVECDALGVVENPAWTQYWDERQEKGDTLSHEEDKAWFRAQGYHRLPPEELQCVECDGRGQVEREVHLHDALAKMGLVDVIPF